MLIVLEPLLQMRNFACLEARLADKVASVAIIDHFGISRQNIGHT